MAADVLTKDLITYDPLSATTRKERTSLLGLSMLGIALVKVPLVPEKFNALSIEFSHINQGMFVKLYALVVAYYCVAFGIYAFSDYVAWRRQEVILSHEYTAQQKERQANKKVNLDDLLSERYSKNGPGSDELCYRGAAGYTLAFLVARLRAAFEFLMPLAFAAYSMSALLRYVPKP